MATVSSGGAAARPLAAAAIDTRVLDGLGALEERGDSRFVDRVIADFLADAPARLTAMRRAHGAGDLDAVTRLAHDLKSNSGNLGALGLSRLCGELQERRRSGASEGLSPLLAAIEAEFERVHADLSAHIRDRAA